MTFVVVANVKRATSYQALPEHFLFPALRAVYCTIGCCAASDMATLSLRSFQHPCPAARKLTISRYECHNQSHQKGQL